MKKYFKTLLLLVIIILAVFAYFSGIFSKGPHTTVMSNRTPEQAEQHVQDLLSKSTVITNQNPVVGVGTGTDFDAVTRQAVKNAGGLKGIIKKGDTVLIKPNLIVGSKPEDARITDYRVVQSLVDQAIESGASKVVVADGSPHGAVITMAETGYPSLKNCEIIDFDKLNLEDCYPLKPLNPLVPKQTYYIPKIYMDADVVISAAKLKTHCETKVSLTLKNAFGVVYLGNSSIGIGRSYLHINHFDKSIADINMIRRPDFALIDGIAGGEGYGPLNNTPVDSRVVFASTDPVACDTVGVTFMGFKLSDIPYIGRAAECSLGIGDLSKIKVVGADLEKIKMSFKFSIGLDNFKLD